LIICFLKISKCRTISDSVVYRSRQ